MRSVSISKKVQLMECLNGHLVLASGILLVAVYLEREIAINESTVWWALSFERYHFVVYAVITALHIEFINDLPLGDTALIF